MGFRKGKLDSQFGMDGVYVCLSMLRLFQQSMLIDVLQTDYNVSYRDCCLKIYLECTSLYNDQHIEMNVVAYFGRRMHKRSQSFSLPIPG